MRTPALTALFQRAADADLVDYLGLINTGRKHPASRLVDEERVLSGMRMASYLDIGRKATGPIFVFPEPRSLLAGVDSAGVRGRATGLAVDDRVYGDSNRLVLLRRIGLTQRQLLDAIALSMTVTEAERVRVTGWPSVATVRLLLALRGQAD